MLPCNWYIGYQWKKFMGTEFFEESRVFWSLVFGIAYCFGIAW